MKQTFLRLATLIVLVAFIPTAAAATGLGDLVNQLQEGITSTNGGSTTGSVTSGSSSSGGIGDSLSSLFGGLFSSIKTFVSTLGDLLKGIFATTGTATKTGTNGGSSSGSSGTASGTSGATAAGAVAASNNTEATGIAKKIVDEAMKEVNTTKYKTAATDYGNLACAAYVSGVLKTTGAMKGNGSLNTTGLRGVLENQGWKTVSLSEIKPGDVIFWGPNKGGKHGHVGIIEGKHGGTCYTCDNSSAARVPKNRPLNTSRTILCVLRHPSAS